jgi:hypothetical protein
MPENKTPKCAGGSAAMKEKNLTSLFGTIRLDLFAVSIQNTRFCYQGEHKEISSKITTIQTIEGLSKH